MRPAAGSLLLLAGATLASLAAGELALRRLRPAEVPRFRSDPVLLHALRPGYRHTYTFLPADGEREVDFQVDGQGYRVGTRPVAPGAVVVYGDSFVEGLSTPTAETFAARLEVHLGQPVVNAGVGGYGPDQSCLRLERERAALAPRALVVAIYAGNDWGDLLRNKLFGLDAAGRLVQRRPVLAPSLAPDLEPPPPLAVLRALRRLTTRRERLPPDIGTLAWAERECARDWADHLAGDTVVNLLRDHYDPDLALAPESPPGRYKAALMRALLARLRSSVGGLPAVLLVIPAAHDACPGHERARELRARPGYRPSALTDRLAADARAAGFAHVVDLWAPFAERGGDSLYYPVDRHWNAEAQEMAAALVADALREQGVRP